MAYVIVAGFTIVVLDIVENLKKDSTLWYCFLGAVVITVIIGILEGLQESDKRY